MDQPLIRRCSVGETHRLRLLGLGSLVVAWVGAWPVSSLAGPPLFADDPNTVGPGVVQPILSATGVRQGDETLLLAPIADVTIGLVDSLDAILVLSMASLNDTTATPRWSLDPVVAVGAKWEFFRGEHGSLALSPAFVYAGNYAGLLSMQGEFGVGRRGKTRIGFDAGFVPVRRSRDEWFVASYLNWAATRRLIVLAEVWAVSFGRAETADVGTSVGIDFGISGDAVRLLADFGTGIVSFGGPRIDYRVYLGVQLTFGQRRDRWRQTPRTAPQ